MEKPKPCPFCTGEDLKNSQHLKYDMWFVSCVDCSARGPTVVKKEDAIRFWNERFLVETKKYCQICGNKTKKIHKQKEFIRSPINSHCPINIHAGADTYKEYEMCETCFKALLHWGMIE